MKWIEFHISEMSSSNAKYVSCFKQNISSPIEYIRYKVFEVRIIFCVHECLSLCHIYILSNRSNWNEIFIPYRCLLSLPADCVTDTVAVLLPSIELLEAGRQLNYFIASWTSLDLYGIKNLEINASYPFNRNNYSSSGDHWPSTSIIHILSSRNYVSIVGVSPR